MAGSKLTTTIMGAALVMTGAACSGTDLEAPEPYVTDRRDEIRQEYGTVFGDDRGFTLFSSRDRDENGGAVGGGIGVNPFLWRASLETIDFMPLTQTDPFGGVIITEWYTPPDTADERFKLNVYILGRELRADGVRVSAFRQTRGDGGWTDAAMDPEIATTIENSILTRARELRVASRGLAEG